MNNRIYGMTGGQFSPLSGPDISATTAPYRTIDKSFDVVELAKAAGATFVARTTSYHAQQPRRSSKRPSRIKALRWSKCSPSARPIFGRKNKIGDAPDMIRWFKDHTTPIGSKAKQEHPELIERGIFVQHEEPEYCEKYQKIVERARKGRN